MREIEEAAKQKRAADEAARRKQQLIDEARPVRLARAQLEQRERVFRHSVGGGTNVQIALVFVAFVIPVAGYLALSQVHPLSGIADDAAMGVAGLLGIGIYFAVADRVQGLLAKRRFEAFVAPLDWLDALKYRDAISENRRRSTLIVRIDFDGPFKGNKADVVDAVKTWTRLKSVEWMVERLELMTEPLKTTETVSGRGSSDTFFTNRELHLAFKSIVEDVMPKLAAVTPIQQVYWIIDGDIEPWDKELSIAD
ncbi:MAG: hypothetical protein QM723_31435 [Myxococcaceae bacterium]